MDARPRVLVVPGGARGVALLVLTVQIPHIVEIVQHKGLRAVPESRNGYVFPG
jgi:hypothetical protein